jgi:hypothetical protein
VSVTQLAQDEGEHKKGDILISIPDDLVPRLGDFLGKIGIDSTKEACEVPSESTKRDEELGKRVPPALDELTEECREALLGMTNALFEAGNDMMQQMQLAEPNNPFNPANNPEGAFVPMLAQGELRVLQEWARGRYRNRPGNPPGPLNNDQFGNLIARGAVALSIVWLYMLQSYANQVWWSEKQLTKSKLEEYKCPEEDPVCLDDVCKGEKTAFLTGKSEQLGYCTEVINSYLMLSHRLICWVGKY